MANHKIIRRNGQRIAWTNTSRIPDDEVVAAIKFVADEINLDRTVVHFKKLSQRSGRYGRAYGGIPSIANLDGLKRHEWRYLIVATDHFCSQMSKNALRTLAHEARHIEQFRTGTIRKAKKQRQCEAQARSFGDWAAERWVASRGR
jgi:hypothetical protein